jgi:orotate phosphoribosyltransferase
VNPYDPMDNVVHLHSGPDMTRVDGTSSSIELVPRATASSAPTQLRLSSDGRPTDATAGALAARLATAPGLVRPGASRWDDGRTPIHPLSVESAYADPALLRELGAHGARFARELGVDVVVGAETAGVPLAASISLEAGVPFAFVRKPGYRGHEIDEPPVRGAEVAGRRVLLVDDAIASGTAVERFTAALIGAGAEVVGGVRPRRHARDRGQRVERGRRAPHGVGEHVPAGPRPRHRRRPPRARRPRAQRRRAGEPMDRRRSAVGSPVRGRLNLLTGTALEP